MNKDILIFDVDGVLIHGYHAKPELQVPWDLTLEEDCGIDRVQFRETFIFGTFVKDVITGRRPLLEALDETLPRLGYKGDASTFVQYWLEKDSCVNIELLNHIKKIKEEGNAWLLIATNQEHMRASYIMQTLGFELYFDEIFYSAKIGIAKPAAAFFEEINKSLDKYGTSTPVMFDDTPSVVSAARNAGWEAHEYSSINDLFKSPTLTRLCGR